MLVIEITESLLLSEDERAWGYLAELRRDGVRIAIDDYGTGYASAELPAPVRHRHHQDRPSLPGGSGVGPQSESCSRRSWESPASLVWKQIAEGVEDPYARDVLVQFGLPVRTGLPVRARDGRPSQANLWGLPGRFRLRQVVAAVRTMSVDLFAG